MPTQLTIRFDFDGERRLGPGQGRAARGDRVDLIDLRRWPRAQDVLSTRPGCFVEELNHLFGHALVTARPGGVKGGGAELTPAGERSRRALP